MTTAAARPLRKTNDVVWIFHRGSPSYNEVVFDQGKGRGLKIRVCHTPPGAHVHTRQTEMYTTTTTPASPMRDTSGAIWILRRGSPSYNGISLDQSNGRRSWRLVSGTHTPADLRCTTVRDVYDNDRSSPPMHNMSGAIRSFHCGRPRAFKKRLIIGHSLVARKRIPHCLFLDRASDSKPPIDRNDSRSIAAALAAGSRVVISANQVELDKVTGESRASLARKQRRPGSKTDWEATRTRPGDPESRAYLSPQADCSRAIKQYTGGGDRSPYKQEHRHRATKGHSRHLYSRTSGALILGRAESPTPHRSSMTWHTTRLEPRSTISLDARTIRHPHHPDHGLGTLKRLKRLANIDHASSSGRIWQANIHVGVTAT
jgi:hypothetical protein